MPTLRQRVPNPASVRHPWDHDLSFWAWNSRRPRYIIYIETLLPAIRRFDKENKIPKLTWEGQPLANFQADFGQGAGMQGTQQSSYQVRCRLHRQDRAHGQHVWGPWGSATCERPDGSAYIDAGDAFSLLQNDKCNKSRLTKVLDKLALSVLRTRRW